MKTLLKSPIMTCGVITGISVAALAAALIAQYGFSLQPCELCLYQRVPYALAGLLGLTGLARPRDASPIALICGIVFTAGAAIAFYHHGVEQHWWKSFLTGCSAGLDTSKDLMTQIENTKAVRCDVIPWADPIFGQSMAAWNVPASLAFAAYCFTASFKLRAQKL